MIRSFMKFQKAPLQKSFCGLSEGMGSPGGYISITPNIKQILINSKRFFAFLLLSISLINPAQAVDFSSAAYSETDSSNTSASPNGWPSGTFFNQVEPIGRATLGATKRFWDRINGTVTTSGPSGFYFYSPSSVTYPAAYITGETFTFIAHQDGAGSDKLNVNLLGSKNLYKVTSSGATLLAAGDIKSGAHIMAQYDSSLNSSAGGFYVIGGLTQVSTSSFLTAANNLSDLASTSVALSNLSGVSTARNLLVSGLVTGGGTLAADRTFTVTAATQSDMETATSTTTAVTPAVVQNNPGVAKAWVVFDGTGTNPITKLAGYNISGTITKNGTGDFTISFTTPFSSGNYAFAGGGSNNGGNSGQINVDSGTLPSTGSIRINVKNNAGTKIDTNYVTVTFFGDQ